MRFACTAARSSGSSAPTSRPRAWSACSSGRSASRTGSRCWPTGGSWTSPTSSGARGSATTTAGSASRCRRRTTDTPSRRAAPFRRCPGLYFVGLPFLHSFASMLILGAGRDGKRVAEHIVARAARAPRRSDLQVADGVRMNRVLVWNGRRCERPGSWAGRGTVRRCARADNRGEGRSGRAALSGRRAGARRRRCARPSTASR